MINKNIYFQTILSFHQPFPDFLVQVISGKAQTAHSPIRDLKWPASFQSSSALTLNVSRALFISRTLIIRLPCEMCNYWSKKTNFQNLKKYLVSIYSRYIWNSISKKKWLQRGKIKYFTLTVWVRSSLIAWDSCTVYSHDLNSRRSRFMNVKS